MTKRNSKRLTPFQVWIMGEPLTLHRATGQGYLRVYAPKRGKKVRRYFGRLRDDDGHVIAETVERAQLWLTKRVEASTVPLHPELDVDHELTVAELASVFLADKRQNASKTEQSQFRAALSFAVEEFGNTMARAFRGRAFQETREKMIASGRYKRGTLNNRCDRIRAMFKWAAANELVPQETYAALMTVDRVKLGEDARLEVAREVKGVPSDRVVAIWPFLSRQLRAVVRLQLLTGARAGEILGLRPSDVDRESERWVLRIRRHRTAHHGKRREIPLSEAAKSILAPWLLRADDSPCFQPCEAESERRATDYDQREASLDEGNLPGYSGRTREGREPLRQPGEIYSTASFRQAIHRACDKAGVERWNPHQLRHLAAELAEQRIGDEHAGALLGHSNAKTTRAYHEDRQRQRKAEQAADVLAEEFRDVLGL